MSRPPVVALLTLVAAAWLAACSSADGSGAASGSDTPASETDTSATSTTAEPVANPTTETTPTTSGSAMEPDDDRAACRRLTNFDDDEANQRWLVVNDDVMGGRSLGGLAFDQGTLVFEGDINTNGGGFSSLRLPLEPEALVGQDRIEFRARPDGRAYMVTFDDELPRRDRRVSHRAPIDFGPAGEWQTVSVAFGDLFPAIFGQPIEDLPFRPDLATRMGLMISDGLDGPFRLEVDWIDLCAGDDSDR